MSGRPFIPTTVDQHVGQRIQLRRTMMGLSQKDLADNCGVSFQQIQKYETAGNRISASRLFSISQVLQTPVSFFFSGLPGNMPEETKTTRSARMSEPRVDDDPLSKNETLQLIKLYWKLPDDQREMIMKMLKTLTGV